MNQDDKPSAKKVWAKPEVWTMKLNDREIAALFGKQRNRKDTDSAAA